MANPAQLLLNQLRAWNKANQSAQKAREPLNWTAHRIAVRHLDAIDELLAQLEQAGRNTTVFRRHYPTWCQIVFTYPNGWTAQNSAAINQTALEHLENLADRLDDYVPTLRPGGLDEIQSYAEGILQLLDEDDTLDQLLKLHIGQVVAHLNWCVNNYGAVGDFDLQEAVERLASSILRAWSASGHKDWWRAKADKFVWPFMVNMIAAIPGNALAQLILGH
ncbi:hypothetical protein NJB1604_53000 [Mycobacterium marinum]|uniref:hypothetical protein n=1 Tax=Mycobacterium marinum TaxID=1781 RepID=UPI0021C26D75|nr:hypothetical protein [Mycobacterium marinum]GJO59116.1 hypothetical protein NJB1604_53000 [Mycobacterium marinum]